MFVVDNEAYYTDKGDILKESGEARSRGEKKVITYLESQIKRDNRCG